MSYERLVRAFNINLSFINRRINQLEGILPEKTTVLQDKQSTTEIPASFAK